MAFDLGKAGRGLFSGALASAPSGNIPLIAGSAALSALLAGAGGRKKFDRKPFVDSFRKHRRDTLDSLKPYERETGSQLTQSFAAKGLGNSPLASGIAQASKRQLRQKVLSQLLGQENELLRDLDTAELADDRQRSNETKREILGIALQAGGLISDIGSDEDAEPGIKAIQNLLGIKFGESDDDGTGADTGDADGGTVKLGDTDLEVEATSVLGGLIKNYGAPLANVVSNVPGGWETIYGLFTDDDDDVATNPMFDPVQIPQHKQTQPPFQTPTPISWEEAIGELGDLQTLPFRPGDDATMETLPLKPPPGVNFNQWQEFLDYLKSQGFQLLSS